MSVVCSCVCLIAVAVLAEAASAWGWLRSAELAEHHPLICQTWGRQARTHPRCASPAWWWVLYTPHTPLHCVPVPVGLRRVAAFTTHGCLSRRRMVSPSLCVRVGLCEGHHVVHCLHVLLVVLLVPEHGQIRLDVSYYTVDLALYCSHDLQVFAFPGVLVWVGST